MAASDSDGPAGSAQRFRAATWYIVAACLAWALFVTVALVSWRASGFSLVTLGLAAGSVLALAGLADALTLRVTLQADAIDYVCNFRRRRVARADIKRVVAEKGTPLTLELSSGGWVRLPSLGGRLHANTLRAWLRRGA
ncbi:MAG: hypothetical protein JNM76_08250 [Betaproteobacteria bacterium]|nr:hypothetical protein [Betaproteobacteria bacterium]